MGKSRPQLQVGGAIRTFRSSLGIWKKKKTWRNAYYNSLKAGLQRGGGPLREWINKRNIERQIRNRGKNPKLPKVKYSHSTWVDSAVATTSWKDYPPLNPQESVHTREFTGPHAKETKRKIEALEETDSWKRWTDSIDEWRRQQRGGGRRRLVSRLSNTGTSSSRAFQKGAGVIDWYNKRQMYKKIRARGKDPTKSKVKYRHIVYDDSAITGKSWYDYPPLDLAEDTVTREYIGPTAKETQRVLEDMRSQDWYKKWKASLKEPFKPHR